MSGDGNWFLFERWTRCGKPNCRCAVDSGARHGPYWELRRRNPSTSGQEVIYLGRIHPAPSRKMVEQKVAKLFTSDYMPPAGSQAKVAMKEAVLQLIADLNAVKREAPQELGRFSETENIKNEQR